MVSLLAHAVLGLSVIAWIVASNRHVFSRPDGPLVSPLECLYYVIGIASVVLGWYFNIRFVQEYSQGSTNPLWGQHGSWAEYIRLMFTNPAASSASQDYTIANVVLLPLFTIVDGYRRGLRRPWLYFVSSLFTSFAFAFAFYFATIERQHQHAQTAGAATPIDA